MPNIPEIDFTQSTENIRKQFEKALKQIQSALRSFLLTEATRQDLLAAEKEIKRILSDTDKYIDEWSYEAAESSVEEAIVASLLMLGIASTVEEALEQTKLTRKQTALLDYAVESLQADLKAVTANLERQTRTVIRKSYTDSIKRTATQSQTEISRAAKQMLADADIAIVDKAGRRWKTTTYIDMLANTRLMDSYREAVATDGVTRGNGHAYISFNPKTTDPCKDHQYKIVKLAPDIESPYPYYRDLNHIWHPNCRHYLIPITSFDDLPARVRAKNGL